MAWIILLLSAIFEAIWATALGASEGFTKPIPVVIFLITNAISMFGLAWAIKTIPVGTAYAVWTGVGAALTVSYAMMTGQEAITTAKVIFLSAIILSVIGLKLVPSPKKAQE